MSGDAEWQGNPPLADITYNCNCDEYFLPKENCTVILLHILFCGYMEWQGNSPLAKTTYNCTCDQNFLPKENYTVILLHSLCCFAPQISSFDSASVELRGRVFILDYSHLLWIFPVTSKVNYWAVSFGRQSMIIIGEGYFVGFIAVCQRRFAH